MLKILIFIDWYEPGYKAGGPIRSVKNLVDRLKGEREIYIITSNQDYQEKEPYLEVKSNTWNQREKHVQIFYASSDNVSFFNFYRLVREVKPDILYVNGVYSFYYSILPLLIAKLLRLRKLLISPRGMLADSAISVKAGKKKLFLQLVKRIGFYRNIIFHATKEEEEVEIQKVLGGKNNVHVIPNLSKAERQIPWKTARKEVGILRLAWMGRMSPEKNTLFALEVLEKCRHGRIDLDLYGAVYDQEYWKLCETVMERMPGNITVSFKGSLPNTEVVPKLQTYHFLFLPSRGENFGHIILESLSAGTPVVISDQTPWRNLREKNIGFDLSIEDHSIFVKVIGELVDMNQQEFNKMSEAAYRYAGEIISDVSLVEKYLKLFSVDPENKEKQSG